MTIDDKIRDEKLQYKINGEAAKISALSQVKLIKMNISHVKKHYLPNKVELQNNLSLFILLIPLS